METATILIIFVSTLLLGVTGFSIYSAFGPGSKVLTDPFEEHED
jgi:PsbN protein|nr:photosystem II protein N [Meringosphaera mediterranea]WLD05703.1 photosystem II protein N [Meringosphaera mediterranea]WLD05887.1 photosystem II protein N [Meringosphaera mediterranea]WLD06107.1 photosystem II protein N [Meringosphaera mediterranea]